MNQPLDAHRYWIERHRRYGASLRSVGCRSLRERANQLQYELIRWQYRRVLDGLNLPASTEVLDAGAGIGMYEDLFLERGWNVTATDVSSEALEKLQRRFPGVATHVTTLSNISTDRQYDIVHCFDVLYHVLDQREWQASLQKLCAASRRYVILHGSFPRRQPGWQVSHVRVQTLDKVRDAFARHGFNQTLERPTLAAYAFPWYYLRNIFPVVAFRIDVAAAGHAWLRRLLPGTQSIQVFSSPEYV